MSSSVNRGSECTLCNVVCVPACVDTYVCVRVYVCVYVSSCVCLQAYVKDSRERKFETEEGRKILDGRKRKQSVFRAVSVLPLRPVCSRSHVFIAMFRSSSSNSAPFFSQVHVCQWLLLSLSSLNLLDQNNFLSTLYLLFYFKFICFFLLLPFFMCFTFVPQLN